MSRKPPKTLAELARRLGYSSRAVGNWRRMEGAPSGFDLEDWRAFMKTHRLGTASTRVPPEREALLRQKLEEQIGLLRVQRARAEGMTVQREAVDKLLFTISSKQKSLLYAAFSTTLPLELAGQDATAIRARLLKLADELCQMMIDEYASWVREAGFDVEGTTNAG